MNRIFLVFILITSTFCKAQKQGNNWFFGEKIGITFNFGKPTLLTKSAMDAYGGSACISTSNGRLLYYTNGGYLFDSTHTSPMGHLGGAPSSLQNSLFVPRPDSSHRIYIFTTKGFKGNLIYSEIDTRLNSGRGDYVTGKFSITLTNNVSGKLTAVKHANRVDYWVLVQTISDTIFAYLINSSGVSSKPVISKIGYKDNCNGAERIMKLSPDGNKICSNYCFDSSFVADFNSSTGAVSNIKRFISNGIAVEFSAKSKFLYTLSNNSLWQFDLSYKTQSEFINSRKTVDSNYNNATGMLQLGPDGKIYFPVLGDEYLHVILFPDNLGDRCIPQRNYLYLGKKNYSQGLPDMIQSLFYKKSFGIAQICTRDTTYFTITNGHFLDSAYWDFGDTASGTLNISRKTTNIFHSYINPGTYTTKLISYHKGFIDTIYETFVINHSRPFLGDDLTICNSKKITLNPKGSFKSYKWIDGSTNKTLSVTKSGNYSLTVTDYDGCVSSDTVNVTNVLIKSNLSLSDTTLCLNSKNLNLTDITKYTGDSRGNSMWNFGDGTTSSDSITTKNYAQTGTFNIKLISTSKLGCQDSISKSFTIWPSPVIAFSVNDTSQCFNSNSFDFYNNSSISEGILNYVWDLNGTLSTQKNLSKVTFNKIGQHLIKLIGISGNNCKDSLSKSITIEQSPLAEFSFGNTCNLNPIQFIFTGTKPSAPIITSFNWDFAGEGTSTLENPSQKIGAGNRNIKLKLTASNGCIDLIDKDVDIKPQAIADFDGEDVCEDTLAIFTNKTNISSGVANYFWTFGDGKTSNFDNPTHKYEVAGVSKTFNVKMIAKVHNGCSDSITKAITINANPKPGFTYTTSGQTVNFIASENNANTYNWSFGDGGFITSSTKTQSHTYSKFPSGKYSACLTTTNLAGCSSDSCIEIFISGGIRNINSTGIQIYPNPNTGSFTVEIPNLSAITQLQLYNCIGQLVYESSTVATINKLETNLDKGIYILKIINEESIYNQKIQIE